MLLLKQAKLEKLNLKQSNSSNESSANSSDSEKSFSKYHQPRNVSQRFKNISITSRNVHHYYAIKRKSNLYKYKHTSKNQTKQTEIHQEEEPMKHLPKIFTQAKNFIRLFSVNKKNQIDSQINDKNVNTKTKLDEKLNLKSKRLAKLIISQQQKFNLDKNKTHRVPFNSYYGLVTIVPENTQN